jgi:asparagine synthase (glutamine-hydrolysing)
VQVSKRWHADPDHGTFGRGTVVLDGASQLDGVALSRQLQRCDSLVEAKTLLTRSSGFFATISRGQDTLTAAVDIVRSIPVFYGIDPHGVLCIGDDAEWVRKCVGEEAIDPVAFDEFLLSGYVSGNHTLFGSVKQLQAGELLEATIVNGQVRIITETYWAFELNRNGTETKAACPSELLKIVERCIQRLINHAEGRQILVPLSAGHDSRLIALQLRRAGYDNVRTFTYGPPRSHERRTAEAVAKSLGLKWTWVPYTRAQWKAAWSLEKRGKFQIWASGWSSLPHVQDWAALQAIQQCADIEDNCVIVPGHGAMAILSHLRPIPENADAKEIIDILWERKYRLSPMSDRRAEGVRARVADRVERTAADRSARSIYAQIEWRERQSKFLVNSVRAYECFGFDWWLPLWDREFCDYWAQAPMGTSQNKDWYKSAVDVTFAEWTDKGSPTSIIKNPIARLPTVIAGRVARSRVNILLRKVIPYMGMNRNLLGFEARFSGDEVNKLWRKGYRGNGMEAYFVLQLMQRHLAATASTVDSGVVH